MDPETVIPPNRDYGKEQGEAVECVKLAMARFNMTEEEIVDSLIAKANKQLRRGTVFEIRKSIPRLHADAPYVDYGLAWYTNNHIQMNQRGMVGARTKVLDAKVDIIGGYYLIAVCEAGTP